MDEKKRVLLVKPLVEYDEALEKLSFAYGEQKNGQTRVSSRELMNYLELKCPELDLEQTSRFVAVWEEGQGLLVVDLKKPIVRQKADEEEEVGEAVPQEAI